MQWSGFKYGGCQWVTSKQNRFAWPMDSAWRREWSWNQQGTSWSDRIAWEQAGKTGLLAARSLSGAGPEILVDWIFWDFRTVFGNPLRINRLASSFTFSLT